MTIVKDAMSKNVEFLEPDNTVSIAAKMMRNADCGALPVAENDRLVGMITDRDIVVRCIAEDKEPLFEEVGNFMTKKVLYCFDTDAIDEIAANMAQNKIRRLPVVNQDKRLVGIISLGDLSHTPEGKDICGPVMDRIAA